MTATKANRALEVPARAIPVPTSISPEAQAYLASPAVPSSEYPPMQDLAGWRKLVASMDELILAHVSGINAGGAAVEHMEIDDTGVFAISPPNAVLDDRRVCLDVHGGGLIIGGGEVCRATGIFTATRFGMHTWTVDYRMPPDHPYPAGLDDCVAAYRALLKQRQPSEIVIGGVSAGANLAAALILRARDEGLPLPAAAILLTPQLDLTESGDSFRTNLGVDTVLNDGTMPANLLYANGHHLTDPYLSPLFGDFSAGFPPTLLASGTRDLFLSNTVRMHRALRAAGVTAGLHVLEAAPHGLLPGTPEDEDLLKEVREFIGTHCQADPSPPGAAPHSSLALVPPGPRRNRGSDTTVSHQNS
jgi:epsilon-lactone hydrolase